MNFKSYGMLVAISVAMAGCATTLNQKANSISSVLTIPSKTCVNKGEVEFHSNLPAENDSSMINGLRNSALKFDGVNTVVKTRSEFKNSRHEIYGMALACPAQVSLTDDQLSKKCDSESDFVSCVIYSERLDGQSESKGRYEAQMSSLNRACSGGVKTACFDKTAVAKAQGEYLEKEKTVEEERKQDALLEKRCRKQNDGKACLRLMASRYEAGDQRGAIIFAQLACINHEQNGCSFHSSLVSEGTAIKSAELNVRASEVRARGEVRKAQIQAQSDQILESRRQTAQANAEAEKKIHNAFNPPEKKKSKCTTKNVMGELVTDCEEN